MRVVVPDDGGQSEDALNDAAADAGDGFAVVSKTHSMTWRSGLKNCAPGRGFSPLRALRSISMPAWPISASKLVP